MPTPQEYMKNGYTPYSVRNNIEDPELAWLLDYLEREMGWDIKMSIENLDFDIKNILHTIIKKKNTIYYFHFNWVEEIQIIKMNIRIFFRTYKTLLPVIKNLYSK